MPPRFTGRRLGKRKRKGFEQTGMDGAVWTAARRRSRRSMTVPAGGKRAWFARPRAAFLWAISVAPSPQRPPKSSILAGDASFGHGTGMRLGSGASRCRLAQHGGNHGQRRLRFSAVLLYGIIRHGDCPRGREPAHLMQPLCLATLLGQCVQVRENVAGD